MTNKIQLDPIEKAIEAIRNGKIIIVVDDEDRENEGDFLCCAEGITDEMVNFMVTHGRGLMCAPITNETCEALDLQMMVGNNTDPKGTAFTVSIDLMGEGVTTGISASDRAKTLQALTEPNRLPNHFSRPGHIFPLKAKNGGVLERAGHTEAAVDFARLAGKKPVGVIVEIMNADGSMARLPELRKIADQFNLPLVSIEDLIAYRLQHESLIQQFDQFDIKTHYGDFKLTAYKQTNNGLIHLALSKGQWSRDETVPVRVIATKHYFDLFNTLEKGEPFDLKNIKNILENEGKGVILLINSMRQKDYLLNQLQQYKAYQEGKSNSPTLQIDNKDYGIGAQMIKALNIHKINIISNHPITLKTIEGYGIQIVGYINY